MEVINNVLEPANEPGWNAFAEVSVMSMSDSHETVSSSHFYVQTEIGSEKLLLSAEMYGRYFAQALMNENVSISREIRETMAIARNNIGMQESILILDCCLMFIQLFKLLLWIQVTLTTFCTQVILILNSGQTLEWRRAFFHESS